MRKIRAKRIISFILTMAMIAGILPAGILNVGAAEIEQQYNTFSEPDLINLTNEPPDDNLNNADKISEELEQIGSPENETELPNEDEREEELPFEPYVYENVITYGDFEYIIEEPPMAMSFSATSGISNNNQGTITGYTGTEVHIEIPEKIGDITITSIGNQAFYNNQIIRTVKLSNSIQTIGNDAFRNASLLTSVTIEKDSKLDSIGTYAFASCAELAEINLDVSLIRTIGNNAFDNCSSLESITMPRYLETIGNYTFRNNTRLMTLNLNEGLKTIGSYSFDSCSALVELTIPDSVTTINTSGYTFRGCTSLESVVFGSDLRDIPQYMFENCTALASVTFGENITNIDRNAFDNCRALTIIEMPDSLQTIKAYAFRNNTRLHTLKLNDSNNLREIYGGAFQNCTSLITVDIPDSVNRIDNTSAWTSDGVFRGCISLESVTLGSGLQNIPRYMFEGCISLEKVTIGDTVGEIGDYAFQNCISLEELALGATVITIGNNAFENCASLISVTMPAKLTNIGQYAFRNNRRLQTVILKDDLQTIGQGAFNNCSSLRTITIPDSVTQIESSSGTYATFGNCKSLTNAVIGNGVYSIPQYMFDGCDILSSVTFGNRVATIGNYAFRGTAVSILTLPDTIDRIEQYAFQNCTRLTSISLGNGLSFIGNYAFDNCISLRMIHFGTNLVTIGDYAFRNNKSLPAIRLPAGVIVGTNAFQGTRGLLGNFNVSGSNSLKKDVSEEIHEQAQAFIPAAAVTVGTLANTSNEDIEDATVESVQSVSVQITAASEQIFTYTFRTVSGNRLATVTGYASTDSNVIIPSTVLENGVTTATVDTIGSSAFKDKTAIITVTLPSTIRTINSSAFSGCTNLTSIDLNEGLQTISGNAFENCSNLTSLKMPSTLQTIGNYAFRNNIRLVTLNLNEGLQTIGTGAFYSVAITSLLIPNSVTTINSSSGTSAAFGNCTKLTTVELGSRFQNIPNYMFEGCNVLNSVTIGEKVMNIGQGAFSGCIVLSAIKLPASVRSIGAYAFRNNERLVNLELNDGLKEIYGGAFQNCTSLITVTIPSSVTRIDNTSAWTSDGVFRDCTSLESVTLGTGLQDMPNYMFDNCRSLKAVTIGDTVRRIGSYSFRGCTALANVILGGTIMEIGEYAFDGCTLISTIELPDSVRSIGAYAFRNNERLVNLKLNNGLKTIGRGAFNGCKILEKVFIPESVIMLGDIGSYSSYGAFIGCTSLKEVHIGNNVQDIPPYAFDGCTALATVTIGEKVMSVGDYAFRGTGITKLTLPNSVLTIGNSAFRECKQLADISFGNGLYTIGDYAFYNCVDIRALNFGSVLRTIGNYAFYNATNQSNTRLTQIVIPNSVIRIGYYAFQGYTSVKNIHIGRSVIEIGNNAFYGSTSLETINMTSSALVIIGNSAFAGINNTSGRNTKLRSIEFPSTLQEIGNFAFDNCNNLISAAIPVSVWIFGTNIFRNAASSGFTIIGVVDSGADDYARNNGYLFEADGDYITLEVDATTNISTLNIAGSAPTGKQVNIYINDSSTPIHAIPFTANLARRWGGTVTLQAEGTYLIRAEITDDSGNKVSSETRTVTYENSAPGLISFIMHHDGQRIDLMTTDGIRQTLVFRSARMFTFEIKVANSDQIEKLFISSVRNNVEKLMEARYMGDNSWIATGYFDPDNTNYVPGRLAVAFSEKFNPLIIGPEDIITVFSEQQISYIRSKIGSEWTNSDVDFVTPPTAAKNDVLLTLADTDNTKIDFVHDYRNIQKTDEVLTSEGFERFITANDSSIWVKADVITPIFNHQTGQPQTGRAKIQVYNPSTGIEDIVTFKQSFTPSAGLVNVGSGLFGRGYMLGALYVQNYRKIIENISNDTKLSQAAKDSFIRDVDKIHAIYQYTNLAIGIVGTSSSITFPPALIALARGLINKLGNSYHNPKYLGINNGGYQIAIIIDPSGYIYEAVPSNRLTGVTTTVYYADIDPITGDFKRDKDGNYIPVKWNAEEFNQKNPLTTDIEGRYSWDVPEGLWRVEAELDGYETAYSTDIYDWLPVPPPQLDVNFGMVSQAAPTVTNTNGYANGIEITFSKYMELSSLTADNISVKQDNVSVNGSIEFINQELDHIHPDKPEYASIIKFVPATEFTSESVTITISKGVQSYSGVRMTADYKNDINIELEPKSIEATNINLEFGTSGNIIVTVQPAAAVVGKEVAAVSSDTFIASVDNEATFNENGQALIPVTALLPGVANITMTLEGTNLQTQATVNITLPQQTHKEVVLVIDIEDSEAKSKGYAVEDNALIVPADATIQNMIDSLSKAGGSQDINNLKVYKGDMEITEYDQPICTGMRFVLEGSNPNEVTNIDFIVKTGDTTRDGKVDMEDAKAFLEALVGNDGLDEDQQLAVKDYHDSSALKSLRKFLNAMPKN